VVRPPISLRRIDGAEGQSVPSHDRSQKTERVERERVHVSTVIGRMIQQVLPKGFQRRRAYGVQATKTFAKSQGLMQEALAKVRGSVQGAMKIIAAKRYRERSRQSAGRDPVLCPHCHQEMGVGKVWHPKDGVV
jgi:hypothetical protein